jgi:fluoroquinolone resistance protein
MSEIPISSQEDYSERTFESVEGKGLVVEESQFENCVFVKCNLGGATFKRCKFIDCIFEHCDLSNLQIQGATFRSTTFKDCKSVGINWANANAITHLNFEKCVLNYAVFSGLDLRKCALKSCVAREADFADANLSEVDCRGTDFTAARFSNTNLMKADLRGATNYSIRPEDNKLKKAKFSLPEATLLLYGLDIVLEE